MNRIERRFAALYQEKKKAFIPYITAGDPSLERTAQLVFAIEEAGADVIELGVPFSDPIADGPVNQEAALRALKNNISLHDVVALVKDLREKSQAPIVLFTYYNPIHAYGIEAFAQDAAAAGVDGVLCVDLPPEESADYKNMLDSAGIATIYLLSPTSTDARIEMIARYSTGFIYYVSRTGVTGVSAGVDEHVKEMVARIRQYSNKPVAVGFGLSTPEQMTEVASYADAVVVGSAIVRLANELGDTDEMPAAVGAFVKTLVEATKGPSSQQDA